MGFGHGLWPCPQPLVPHCRHVPQGSVQCPHLWGPPPSLASESSHGAQASRRGAPRGLPVGAEVSTGFPQPAGLEPHPVTQWGHGHSPVQPYSVICKVRLHWAGPGPPLCPRPLHPAQQPEPSTEDAVVTGATSDVRGQWLKLAFVCPARSSAIPGTLFSLATTPAYWVFLDEKF